MKIAISLTLMLTILIYGYINVNACSVKHVAAAQEICDRATIIVTVTAEDYTNKDQSNSGKIRFKVHEVLKGKVATPYLEIEGTLVDKDDFNDHDVPRNFVRPEGRHGNCFAITYKKNGDFLLFLIVDRDNNYDPNWAPLAATNEQLQSDNDPGLVWVKNKFNNSDSKSISQLPTNLRQDNYFNDLLAAWLNKDQFDVLN